VNVKQLKILFIFFANKSAVLLTKYVFYDHMKITQVPKRRHRYKRNMARKIIAVLTRETNSVELSTTQHEGIHSSTYS
jgi:hypothetical protein